MQFRKKRTLEKYRAYKEKNKKEKPKCDFCLDEPSDKKLVFAHWKILKNIFPYDRIAEEHDLLIPRRHFSEESEMTAEEREELVFIKTRLLPKKKKYDLVWENFSHMRSVSHYHVHLLRAKRASSVKNL
ncbi:MAG: HIT domain-containing protein [Candidatus Paceibacterota bacterium]|jgi:diadenosine tetraphosphate (Ap4A) HIT family hydrolase